MSVDLTLGLSVVALLVSAYLALRQNALQRRVNNAPAIVDLLSQFRAPSTQSAFEFVFTSLPSRDVNGGLSGLPEQERFQVYDIGNWFQQLGCMMILKVVDEATFIALFRARILAAWAAMAPFVRRERELNPAVGPEFMTLLEALAIKAEAAQPEVGLRLLGAWMGRRGARRFAESRQPSPGGTNGVVGIR